MGERRIGNPEGNRSTIGLPSPHPPTWISLDSIQGETTNRSRFIRFRNMRLNGVRGQVKRLLEQGRGREGACIPLRLATGETEGREREREKVAHLPSTATFFSLSLSSSILVSYHLLPLQRNWNYRPKIEASTPTHPSIPFLPCLELIPSKQLPLTLNRGCVAVVEMEGKELFFFNRK